MSPTRAEAESTATGDTGGVEMLRFVQRMFLSTEGSTPQQVVFCGVGSQNGSTSVCANAGKMLAVQSSRSVCLVDGNLSPARLPAFLGVDPAAAAHRKSTYLRDQCVEVADNLWLAGADVLAGESGGLPSVGKLKQIFEDLRGMFDFVLIDAPGADVSGDAAILGKIADGTVLVIDAESTRRIAARKVKEFLETANVRILGTVLNNRSFPIPNGLYDRL